MNGGIEAAGDLATGALMARVFEPEAGEAVPAHPHGLCLNCGTALAGDYCHACGQTAHIHRTLFSLVHDLLHGVLHFEGKIWRTLPMLFTRPGELTRRYFAGERARFVSPLALFLFSVFLTFALFEATGGLFGGHHGTVKRDGVVLTPAQVSTRIDTLKAEIDKLKADRTAARARHEDTEAIDDKIEAVQDDLEGMQTAHAITQGKLDKGIENITANTGVAALDERVKAAAKQPELFVYKLQSSAHKYSWALIPISIPFIWLLFAFRRDVGPYDHAIFAIFSLSAMMLGVCVLSIASAIGVSEAIIGLVLLFGPPFHMYRQLKGAYRLGRVGALWRTAALVISAYVSALLFFILLVGITD